MFDKMELLHNKIENLQFFLKKNHKLNSHLFQLLFLNHFYLNLKVFIDAFFI